MDFSFIMTRDDILRLRKKLKLSQAQFAKYLGVTDRTIRNYESGKMVIPEPVILLINRIASETNSMTNPLSEDLFSKSGLIDRRTKLINFLENLNEMYEMNQVSRDTYIKIEKVLRLELSME